MKEEIYNGNIFLYAKTIFSQGLPTIVITTNGVVRSDGQAVMGSGIAKYANDNLTPVVSMIYQKHTIADELGVLIKKHGNHSFFLGAWHDKKVDMDYYIVTMPTKEHWKNNSDIQLIKRSCNELIWYADKYHLYDIYLPAPGCGCGNLSWDTVYPEISMILDERFHCVHPDKLMCSKVSENKKPECEEKILSFRGNYFFLSNFYDAPIIYEGISYHNTEAAFQAQKCTSEEEKKVFSVLSPKDAKRQGKKVILRSDWEDIKISKMEEIIHCKFMQHYDLAQKLIATGNAYLEEGNQWGDKFWGTVNGTGENMLGKILMKERDILRKSELPK